MGSITNCLTVQIETGTTDDNLTITAGNANGDKLCASLQSAVDIAKYPMKLRGTNVKY